MPSMDTPEAAKRSAPGIGERVTFRGAEGHRCPRIGRPGYYDAHTEYTETWTMQHHARFREGALVVVERSPEEAP